MHFTLFAATTTKKRTEIALFSRSLLTYRRRFCGEKDCLCAVMMGNESFSLAAVAAPAVTALSHYIVERAALTQNARRELSSLSAPVAVADDEWQR